MKRILALAVLLLPAVAGGQHIPPLDVLLDRLYAYSRQYQAALPSLTCDEEITSQDVGKRGKVTREVKVQTTLREIRTEDPYDPFQETREYKTVNGRPLRRPFRLPFFVQGGFANLVGFRRWEQKECFDYVVTPLEGGRNVRLEMTLKTPPANPSCARLPSGFHRIVIAEPDTGRILHSERTIAPEVAAKSTEVYFGGIDYAPQMLGEQTFWLPSRFYAHDAENAGRMFATYSNYHRYSGELKILPDISPAGTGPQPH